HDHDMVGLWGEPLRSARLPAPEGQVRALRVADAPTRPGPRGALPQGAPGRGRALGKEHSRLLAAAGRRIDGKTRGEGGGARGPIANDPRPDRGTLLTPAGAGSTVRVGGARRRRSAARRR